MTRAFFVVKNNRDFNSQVVICFLYKLADGYPSNIQSVIHGAYRKFKREKVFAREPEFISTEAIVSALLGDNCMMWRVSNAKATVDFYDYEYTFTNDTVEIRQHSKLIFKGTLAKFLSYDFSGEWVEDVPTRED